MPLIPCSAQMNKPVPCIILDDEVDALVDVEDWPMLNQFLWSLQVNEGVYQDNLYAVSTAARKIYGTAQMHRIIINAPPGVPVDHINHDGLDNRRANLRLATTSTNAANQRVQGGRKYKGVHFRKDSGRYQVKAEYMTKQHHLGTFDTEIEAAQAYDRFALETWGEYAYLNFRLESEPFIR